MKRELKAYVLLLICILIQVASVFPHHHHAEKFCVQEDWAAASHDEAADHTCDATCITNFQLTSPEHHHSDASPDYSFYTILYPLFAAVHSLFSPQEAVSVETSPYRERLHARNVIRVESLRAPPVLLV